MYVVYILFKFWIILTTYWLLQFIVLFDMNLLPIWVPSDGFTDTKILTYNVEYYNRNMMKIINLAK